MLPRGSISGAFDPGPLIVGGGPAGAAAAIVLARGGLAPRLIERNAAPQDVVCGGFLGWDALRLLQSLGIDAWALGARPIHRVRLVAGERRVEAKLPYRAAGLSRRALDEAVLGLAEREGAEVMRGRTVRRATSDGRSVHLQDGEEIVCGSLLLATGKHELRGVSRPLSAERKRLAVGLRAALPICRRRTAALEGTIELHLFDDGYAGLLLQEDGTTNLCLSVLQQRLREAGGPLPLLQDLVRHAPLLGDRLYSDLPPALSAIAGVPYGWRARATTPGLFRIGDQGAVIASLAGDGIAIALASGMSAARSLLEGRGAPEWQAEFARRSTRPLALAEALRHAAERPLPRAAFMDLLRLAPGLIGPAARLTRIV